MAFDPVVVGVLVFAFCAIGSRLMVARAYGSLAPKQKSALVGALAQMGPRWLIPVVVLLALFYVGLKILPQASTAVFAAFLVLLVGNAAATTLWTRRRLDRLGLPSRFLSRMTQSQALSWLGMGLLLAAMLETMR